MKVAVVDIGSNSIRLLVANFDGRAIVSVCKDLITTRLGIGVAKNNMIDRHSMYHTIHAVKCFVKKAFNFNCDYILSFATSAVRDAVNGSDLLRLIKEEIGLDVKIISEQEEAQLSFSGSRFGLGVSGLALVVDIGGNSTEISFGDDKFVKTGSLPMGAVRWTETYFKSEVPTIMEVEHATNAARKLLHELPFPKKSSGRKVIGVGGTLTSIAAIKLNLQAYNPEVIHGLYLSSEEINLIYHKLLSLSIKEKKKIPGLSPKRAEIITAGSLIICETIREFDISGITISESDTMEGFVLKELNNKI